MAVDLVRGSPFNDVVQIGLEIAAKEQQGVDFLAK